MKRFEDRLRSGTLASLSAAMRLLHERDVPVSDSDRVFRYSRVSIAILYAQWGIGAIYLWVTHPHDPVACTWSIVLLLILLLCREPCSRDFARPTG